MARNAQRRKGKKNRKHGRNKKGCESYRNRGQREINKRRKLKRHLAKFPDDPVAQEALT